MITSFPLNSIFDIKSTVYTFNIDIKITSFFKNFIFSFHKNYRKLSIEIFFSILASFIRLHRSSFPYLYGHFNCIPIDKNESDAAAKKFHSHAAHKPVIILVKPYSISLKPSVSQSSIQ